MTKPEINHQLEGIKPMPDNATMELETALSTALPKLEAAQKNSNNPHFKSKYADLGAVIEAIRPIAEHGIWFRQVLHESERGVTIETLYTGFGVTISAGTLFMPASKSDAQGYGSALTYARRYALQTAFGLSTEDDDGNAASKPKPAEEPDFIDPADVELANKLCEEVGGDQAQRACKAYSVKTLSQLTKKQGEAVINQLRKKLADRAAEAGEGAN